MYITIFLYIIQYIVCYILYPLYINTIYYAICHISVYNNIVEMKVSVNGKVMIIRRCHYSHRDVND